MWVAADQSLTDAFREICEGEDAIDGEGGDKKNKCEVSLSTIPGMSSSKKRASKDA